MGFLSTLNTYAKGYEETAREKLSAFDKQGFKDVASATVTSKEQEWGTSIALCLFMKSGGQKYIPLSKTSSLEVGDDVDIKSIEILTLEREGEEPIYRGDGEAI